MGCAPRRGRGLPTGRPPPTGRGSNRPPQNESSQSSLARPGQSHLRPPRPRSLLDASISSGPWLRARYPVRRKPDRGQEHRETVATEARRGWCAGGEGVEGHVVRSMPSSGLGEDGTNIHSRGKKHEDAPLEYWRWRFLGLLRPLRQSKRSFYFISAQ